MSSFSLEFPDDFLDALAERLAEKLAANPTGPSGWLNVERAADYLACPKSRIYDLVAQGRLECRKDGTGRNAPLKFKREWLDRSLEHNHAQGGDER
jgi:excisionase family DNA binding protein